MTLKKTVRAVLSALLYFGIYFVWQGIVGFWVGLGYEMYAISTYGIEIMDDLQTIQNLSYDFFMKYAIHVTLISNVLAFITYIVLFRMRKMKFTREVGLTTLNFKTCAAMVVLGFVMNIFVSVLLSAVPFPDAWWEQYNSLASAIPSAPVWISLLSTVIVAPIVEETVMRGLFYNRLKRGMPMFAAMLISSWIFGLIHGTVIWVIYASLLGMLLVWIYEKYRSLTASIIFHLSFNLGGFLLGYTNELPTIVVVASMLLSVIIIITVHKSAPGKILFIMPKEEALPTEGDED